MPRPFMVALLTLMLAVSTAHAQQKTDTREALLAEMFDVLQMDAMFDPMMAQFRKVFEDRLRQVEPTITDEEVAAVGDAVVDEVDAMMGPIMRMSAEIMLKYFDERDMRAMLAFYRTPTGQKAIRVMPLMMNDMMAQQQQYMLEIAPRLKKRIEDALREKGYEL